jgi:hypothetical protein
MLKWPCQTITWHIMCSSKIHTQSRDFEMGQDNHIQTMAMRDKTR